MFNALFLACPSIGHFSTVISILENLIGHFSAEYAVDKNAKNAAIDAMIEILQSHKDK
jgi:hypothetical protein